MSDVKHESGPKIEASIIADVSYTTRYARIGPPVVYVYLGSLIVGTIKHNFKSKQELNFRLPGFKENTFEFSGVDEAKVFAEKRISTWLDHINKVREHTHDS